MSRLRATNAQRWTPKPGGISDTIAPFVRTCEVEPALGRRVWAVAAAREHRDRRRPAGQRAGVCGRVDAEREAGDHAARRLLPGRARCRAPPSSPYWRRRGARRRRRPRLRARHARARPRCAGPRAGRAGRAAARGSRARTGRRRAGRRLRAARAPTTAEKRSYAARTLRMPQASSSSSSLQRQHARRRALAAPLDVEPAGRAPRSDRLGAGSRRRPAIMPRPPAPAARAAARQRCGRDPAPTRSEPSRSATVRATRRTRPWPRALRLWRSCSS